MPIAAPDATVVRLNSLRTSVPPSECNRSERSVRQCAPKGNRAHTTPGRGAATSRASQRPDDDGAEVQQRAEDSRADAHGGEACARVVPAKRPGRALKGASLHAPADSRRHISRAAPESITPTGASHACPTVRATATATTPRLQLPVWRAASRDGCAAVARMAQAKNCAAPMISSETPPASARRTLSQPASASLLTCHLAPAAAARNTPARMRNGANRFAGLTSSGASGGMLGFTLGLA